MSLVRVTDVEHATPTIVIGRKAFPQGHGCHSDTGESECYLPGDCDIVARIDAAFLHGCSFSLDAKDILSVLFVSDHQIHIGQDRRHTITS